MRQAVKTAALVFITTLAVLHAPETLAQVAGQTKVTTFFSWLLFLVQAAAYSLFALALVTLGYKVAYVDGFKLSDGKGIIIGGLIFGLAGTIATYFTTS